MAKFEPAVAATLKSEGGYFHNDETGETVNRGITLWFLHAIGRPTTPEQLKAMPVTEAVALYREYFWDHYRLGEINDQCLAAKVFDLTVNMGPGAPAAKGKPPVKGGITLLQEAANTLGAGLAVDASIGPLSIAAINRLDPAALYSAYVALAAQHYRDIAAANPALKKDLEEWLERLG